MNRTELRGHLKSDPVITALPSGDALMVFTLVVNGTRWSTQANAQIVTSAFILIRAYSDVVMDLVNGPNGEPRQGDDVYILGSLEQIEVPKGSDPEKTERKTGVTAFQVQVIRRKPRS